MWSPLFCPSLSQALTAVCLVLEANHPEIITQCWCLGGLLSRSLLLMLSMMSLLFFYIRALVWLCVPLCSFVSIVCGGSAYNIDIVRNKSWLGLLHFSNLCCMNDKTVHVCVYVYLFCIYMGRHLHEPKEGVYICILNPRVGK